MILFNTFQNLLIAKFNFLINSDDDKILNNRIEEKFIVNDENEKVELNGINLKNF